jgi:hypothetical protein
MKTLSRSISLILVLLPLPALAEVSDKVASVPQLWLTGVIAGVVALLAGRYRFTLGVILLPISIFLVFAGLEPVRDPFVGPAIISEQGQAYAVAAYGSAFVLLALHLAGLWLSWRRRQRAAA